MRKADISIALIMVCVGGTALTTALSYPEETRMLPILYSIALIALAVFFGLKALSVKSGSEKNPCAKKESLPKALLVMFLILGYIASIEMLGFYSSTLLFLLVFMAILKAAKLYTVILISVLVPLFIYLFFNILLKIPVPEGMFI